DSPSGEVRLTILLAQGDHESRKRPMRLVETVHPLAKEIESHRRPAAPRPFTCLMELSVSAIPEPGCGRRRQRAAVVLLKPWRPDRKLDLLGLRVADDDDQIFAAVQSQIEITPAPAVVPDRLGDRAGQERIGHPPSSSINGSREASLWMPLSVIASIASR